MSAGGTATTITVRPLEFGEVMHTEGGPVLADEGQILMRIPAGERRSLAFVLSPDDAAALAGLLWGASRKGLANRRKARKEARQP